MAIHNGCRGRDKAYVAHFTVGMSAWASDATLDTWLEWAARIVTRPDAIKCGLGPAAITYRVRAGRWQRLAPEAYLTHPPATRPTTAARPFSMAAAMPCCSGRLRSRCGDFGCRSP
ncbi:MAG: hypothetical protein DLM58_11135 [Pseudonocardiales bacterium]|nr:MAG: hypothetical protein DLM58_11135 [Pseudonocardiales bacterium]